MNNTISLIGFGIITIITWHYTSLIRNCLHTPGSFLNVYGRPTQRACKTVWKIRNLPFTSLANFSVKLRRFLLQMIAQYFDYYYYLAAFAGKVLFSSCFFLLLLLLLAPLLRLITSTFLDWFLPNLVTITLTWGELCHMTSKGSKVM